MHLLTYDVRLPPTKIKFDFKLFGSIQDQTKWHSLDNWSSHAINHIG